MPKQFSHFHVHTESSLLDGLARMKDIFKVAAADGQGVMAVTDHGTTGGLFKAKQAAKEAGVDLAPGVELYIAIESDGTFGNRFNPGYQVTAGDLADDSDDNEGNEKRKGYYHLTLVATSTAGWRNLVRITNASEQTKKGRYPMADLKLLAEDTEGLVVLTGCLGGPVLGPTAGGNIDLARKNLSEIIDAFGHDNVFLEVMEHGIGVETKAMPRMWELSQEFGIPMVATNDSHFTHDCDAHAHDAWLALRTLSGKTGPSEYERPLDNPKRYRFTGHGYHIRTTDEMYGLFAPDRPFEGQWPERGLTREQFLLLQGALDNPILPMMLRPAEVSDDQLAAVRAWLAGDGTAPEDDAVAELILRIVREAFYLKEFGRPAQTPSHPRNWWHQACENTQLIASRVEADIIPDNPAMLPSFPTPSGYESTRHFIFDHIRTGARRIYGAELPEDVRNRLKVEWKTIDDMGFADYFAIVYDVVNWSKSPYCVHATDRFEPTFDDGWTCSVEGCTGRKKPILVGPGRGSGAGSMTAYALTITGLDPLRHDLLFERFIEYGRSDWPDFDIDFERERRDEILDYLENKWGAGHVALIGSYGIAKSRRAVKDAARLLGQGKIGALLTKVIPVEAGNPLGFDALLDPDNQSTAEFRRQLTLGGAAAQEVLELAMSFDSVINGASIHACGVIISDRYLPDLLPLRVMKKTLASGEERQRLVTQWDSKDCEKFGMLKLDILSLRNLDIMATAFEYIHEQTGEVFTMETIPDPSDTSDPRVQKAWRLLQDGRTEGIFQAEGAAMTQLIQDVQPENEEHLSAIYALFRPGPISAGMPEHYGLRKNGKEVVEYGMYTNDPHEGEWLAKQLGSSYGILCVTGDTMVYSIDRGHEVPIREIKIGEKVQGVDELNRPVPGTVSAFMENGVKSIIETRMAGGRSLRSTPDHPVLTPTGWREVGDLNPGDVIAAPWSLIGDEGEGTIQQQQRGYTLGLLLGDGSLKNTTQVALYGVDHAVFDAWDKALSIGFGASAARYVGTRGVLRSHVSGTRGGKTASGGPGATANPVLTWLRELGLKDTPNGGRGSYDKFVPAEYLAAPIGVVKHVLAGLWDTDGTFSTTDTGPSAGYKTMSKRLAYDVVHLLQRVGIASTVTSSAAEDDAVAYHVGVVDVRELSRILAPLMAQQSRREVAEHWAGTEPVRKNHRSSTVPNSVVREHLAAEGVSTKAFKATGRTGHGRIASLAKATGSDDFARLANVRWVSVTEQTDAGEEAVYDITVDGPHSFIANGIVIHNCFQEQMMLMGTTIAGFTAGQRSTLRRAIGKKNAELMASIKGEFIEGAGREFYDEDGTLISPVFKVQTAELVWKMFEGAAAYAFNKSHSMAYAYLGYYTAFLKANWPGAYGAAILANTTDKDRRVQALLALPAEGIEVLPPDVNLSQAKSRPEGVEQVRIGLTEVAEMKEAGYAVVAAREASGPFKSFSDLVFRVRVDEEGHKKLPSNQILALIESGALDRFGKRMGLAMVARLAAEVLPAPVPDMEWGVIERSARQRQRLGVSLGEHPLVVFRDQVRNWSKVADTSYGSVTERAIPISMIPNEAGTFVTVIGLLAAFTEGSYKGGRKAAIVIEGSRERIDGIMWDGELSKQRDVVHEDGTVGIPQIGWPVAVTARVTLREFEKEDDEGNITLVVERQLTVRRIDAVVIDDPVTGSLPPAPAVPVLVVNEEPEPAHAERELDASPSACSSPEEAAVPAEPAAKPGAQPEGFVPDASDASDWFDELFGLGDPEPAKSTPEPAQAEAEGEYDLDADGIPYFTRRSATARSYLDLLAVVPASFKEGNTRLEPKSLTKLSRERGVFELLGAGDRVVARIKLV